MATIYAFSVPSGEHKIGYTRNHYKTRLSELQIGNAQKVVASMAFEIPGEVVSEFERRMHKELEFFRVSGEWFDVPINIVGAVFDATYVRLYDEIKSCE